MDQPTICISLAKPTNCSLNSTHSLEKKSSIIVVVGNEPQGSSSSSSSSQTYLPLRYARQVAGLLWKFAKFTGPGAIISVAYIDPDNYQSDLTAGAKFEYKLLCAVVFSNLAAIFLQALSTKLGCVTGMDLAQMNRAHLHPWLNIALWILAECAIICTDIGQVIGTAIALNLLNPKITLIAGCVISVSDTLFILLFYKPDGSIRRLRIFEMFISVFVVAIFVMFCIELSFITAPANQVFKGLLPSKTIFVGQGLFQSCAILGGNIMPHTIYLGSGLVQARMREFDHKNEKYHEARTSNSKSATMLYRPTLSAIKSCMSSTIAELCITLFIVANFVNSAILIVAAASLSEENQNADLPGMYQLFVDTIGQAAGTIFAVGLLFSGISAGIVATMAGQLICEGAMDWRLSPFVRRLVTRCISIVPAVVIAAAAGQRGLAKALVVGNVVLSVSLIFVTAPLVWYTSAERFMRVGVEDGDGVAGMGSGIVGARLRDADAREDGRGDGGATVSLANGWAVTSMGWLLWFVVAGMNVALLTFLGLGIGGDD
ncbi:1eda123d-e63a-4fd1-8a5f-5a04cbdb2bec [Sclerotinia trifoliorum]|uniref:1eda123d-e63a-4fd1-8a5f-5a04cbdb2bec n=1 Tax=Sclerotinia trifoliorum TaxID=28548 RepID=A0A8H2ZPL1_9HELO|nr:1eda123d-e63a-4fd1-8a5f-5a04cbdb2bec [Sclerotinia trifoliorum]